MLAVEGDRSREVWAQLAKVTDPELDEAVTDLDFIEELEVDRDDVCIRFRLPTYWCAANFAFMMAHDMKESVGELPWVDTLRVELLDHFYAESINQGVAENASFEATCGGAAEGGLALLRDTFRRKAFSSRQERLLQHLRTLGWSADAIVGLTIADLDNIALDEQGAHLRDRYMEMRRQWGPDTGEADASSRAGPARLADESETAFVSDKGETLTAIELPIYLRWLRSVRLNSEFNANICRSVLEARKGTRGQSKLPEGWRRISPAGAQQA